MSERIEKEVAETKERLKERLIDQILENNQKKYDEKMIPLIIEDIESSFAEAIRAGEKEKIAIKRCLWETMWEEASNLEDVDIDVMAQKKIILKRIEEKIDTIKEMYEELFDKKFK